MAAGAPFGDEGQGREGGNLDSSYIRATMTRGEWFPLLKTGRRTVRAIRTQQDGSAGDMTLPVRNSLAEDRDIFRGVAALISLQSPRNATNAGRI